MFKALSVRQPWANLISDGQKTVEVRAWQTDYRGDLVICASAIVDAQAALNHDIDTQPTGATICIIEVIDVRPLRQSDAKASMLEAGFQPTGDLYAWLLSNPRRLTPRPVRGQLGLFGIATDIVIPA
jgi:hypothetical protein